MAKVQRAIPHTIINHTKKFLTVRKGTNIVLKFLILVWWWKKCTSTTILLVYHGLRAKKGRVCSHERPKGNNSFLMAFGIRLLNCHYDCEIGAKQQCFQLPILIIDVKWKLLIILLQDISGMFHFDGLWNTYRSW